jgi:hypothetical protein
MGLLSFLSGWSLTKILLVSASQVTGFIYICHHATYFCDLYEARIKFFFGFNGSLVVLKLLIDSINSGLNID